MGAVQVREQAPTIRVLLVEDDRMFAELLRTELERHDDVSVVGWAVDGARAIEQATAATPDVVVLDYRLPGEDGATIAGRLRAVIPDAALVMLTGHSDDAVLRAAMSAGCTGFVSKDQAVVDLVRAIRAVVEGVAALDPARVARLAATPGRDRQREPDALTDREREVLSLLADGASTRRIADRLFISVNTARNHVQRVIRKLGAHSRLEAVASARRAGLLDDERS